MLFWSTWLQTKRLNNRPQDGGDLKIFFIVSVSKDGGDVNYVYVYHYLGGLYFNYEKNI